MSKYFKVELTKVYVVEIDENSSTKHEQLDMASCRVLDEIEEYELGTFCLNTMEFNLDEMTESEKIMSTALHAKPEEYYGCVRDTDTIDE